MLSASEPGKPVWNRVRIKSTPVTGYGARLKKLIPNPNRRSAHYTRQSPFPGFDREIRSLILRLFLTDHELPEKTVLARIASDTARIKKILQQLLRENFSAI